MILGCPKCNGMVEVQPPADWQDTTGEVSVADTAATTPHAIPPVLRETAATSSRWVVPSIAAGALLSAGLVSWLVWSQLREPDRGEALPFVATENADSNQTKNPANNDGVTTPAVEAPVNNQVENPATAQQPAVTDPPAVAANPAPQAEVQTPPAAAVTPPAATDAVPLDLAPPKPKLVLKPEEPSAVQPEAPLFARGPEAIPGAATQAKPVAEGEEKPVFAQPEPAPAEMPPPAIAPVAPPAVAAVPLPRTPLKAVNPKQLELTLAAVSYNQVPLHAFLREMSELADTQIGVDEATLFRNGWRLNTPVRLQLENVSVRGALQAVLRPLELDLVVKENYLWIGQPGADEAVHLTRYPIDDLVTKATADADAAELAAQLQRMVPTERWAAGKLEIVPGALLVTQSTAVHDELIVWFEKLRVARGLPLRTKYDPANAQLRRFAPHRYALATRWQLAEPLLSKPVTASFQEPETLGQITDILRRQTDAIVLWDLPALAAAGDSPESLTTFTVGGTSLGTALEQLLDPLGMTVVPLDEMSLLLTTKTAAARRQLTERYSVGRLLEQRRWGMDEAAITVGMRQELAARGIEVAETLPLAWDRASRTLAVTASPVVHRAIEKMLDELPQKPVAATAVIKK